MPEISVIKDGKAIKFGDSEEDAAQSLTKLKNQDKVILTESDGWSCSIINISDIDNPLSAFKAYKDYKEALILEMVNKYKGLLDNRVYEALLQYEVRE